LAAVRVAFFHGRDVDANGLKLLNVIHGFTPGGMGAPLFVGADDGVTTLR
jgi:hypothetical protein